MPIATVDVIVINVLKESFFSSMKKERINIKRKTLFRIILFLVFKIFTFNWLVFYTCLNQ